MANIKEPHLFSPGINLKMCTLTSSTQIQQMKDIAALIECCTFSMLQAILTEYLIGP